MLGFKEFVNEAKIDLKPAIDLVKGLKGQFASYTGNDTKNGYILEFDTKGKVRYTITFDIKKGQLSITKDMLNGEGPESYGTSKISSARTGTIEFAKAWSKFTGDEEDYDIIVGPLNKVY